MGNKSPVFARFGEIELRTEVALLVFTIHVITGWKLPDNEHYEAILVDQLCKKIKEDYYMLNRYEVEYAFRNNPVKDWGKSFNLSLVDEVLAPFLNTKTELKNFVDRLPQTHNLLTMPADWKELCEVNYQQFLSGKYTVDLWPWQLYHEFVNCGMMEENVYEDWLKKAYNLLIFHEWITNQEMDFIEEVKAKGVKHPRVIETAKRLSVEYLYKEAKRMNIKNLFEQCQ